MTRKRNKYGKKEDILEALTTVLWEANEMETRSD